MARSDGGISLMSGSHSEGLRVEAAALVASCLGREHYLVAKLDEWTPFAATGRYRQGSPVDQFCGYLNAAVALIGSGEAQASMSPPCDPELWAHIEGLVEGRMWDKVPAVVVTFVEHWFRSRGGNPSNKSGGKLYGRGLFSELLRPGGALTLGSDLSEQEGWHDLGQGLVKAIGNGHRHGVQDRADAERLAWSVIGLGSLLMGEVRRTYGDRAPAEE